MNLEFSVFSKEEKDNSETSLDSSFDDVDDLILEMESVISETLTRYAKEKDAEFWVEYLK